MGFDPRDWSRASRPRQERVTSNVEALLAENDALRREVMRLTRELDLLRRPQHQPPVADPARISREQVLQWGEALAGQPGWSGLRQAALEALIVRLNRLGFPGHLTLQQRLDRLVSGLGTDLLSAVGGKATKKSTAVLAAFALYGVRASEWLDEDPKRVVLDLQQQLQQSEARRRGRRTRTDQRKTDQRTPDEPWGSRAAALAVLGLEAGASAEAIKQAHRRLVKRHHPDMGGSAEAFRRVNEAYQRLMA
ncbi:hypothetical protein KR49_00940 [Synechococcus sp. KORDI-49]|uniref:J domain-containing protein n=1 Tax=Synechococcus sp. KORDI-49 TaxID=585423 RepID=UPI0004E0A27F|nr:J domain-containing protein [Synechococcus sp. KORDI-49]AII45029.1 hypothetical protein KR49_00940 [Synechococcus sp. KORDI-49]